jgi:acid-sensing ion channel 2
MRLESKLLKFIWFVCFSVSFAYCVVTIYNIIVEFIKFEVLINQQVITEAPVDFPAVTVCNLNPFDRFTAQEYINRVLEKNNISHVSNITRIDINPKFVNNLIKASMLNDQNLTSDSIRHLGFDFDYMLLTCYFNDLPCNSSDFVRRYEYDYTNCYTFNSGFDQQGNKVPIKQVNEAGSDRSLRLELFLGDDGFQSQFILNSGARVVIHNQNTTPIISSEGKDISTGFQTNIGIKRSFLSKLDQPYSDCIKDISSPNSFDSHYYRAIFDILNMTTYRQKICLRICLQEHIRSTCKCIDGSLPNIYPGKSFVCSTIYSLECIEKQRVIYFSNSKLSECKQCPLECDSSSFQITTSSSRYPTRYYLGYLRAKTTIVARFPPNTTVDDGQITKGCAFLNVFFDDLATTYTEELAQLTPLSLLGTIGNRFFTFLIFFLN